MRISRHQMFMGIARVSAQRSTCHRLNVGAVVVRESNVVSIGYNGAPSGVEHCGGTTCPHFNGKACSVVHAEANALTRAPAYSSWGEEMRTRPWSIYVTHSPCRACAELIREVPIKSVYYEAEYRDATPLEHLLKHAIDVYRLLPSGYVVNNRTGEVTVE